MTEWQTDPGQRGYGQRRMAWTDSLGLCLVRDDLRGALWGMTLGSRGGWVMASDDLTGAWICPDLFAPLPAPPETGIRSLNDSWKPIATAPDWPLPYDLAGWCDTFGIYPMTRLRDGGFAMLSCSKGKIIKDGDNPDAALPIAPTHWQPLSNFTPVTS